MYHYMKDKNIEINQKDCPFLLFCKIMGRKWSVPILLNLKNGEKYNFTDIVHFTSRRINRTLLSNMLKDFIKIGIMQKNKGKYSITTLGKKVKKNVIAVKKLFLNECDDCLVQIKNDCEVLEFFKTN